MLESIKYSADGKRIMAVGSTHYPIAVRILTTGPVKKVMAFHRLLGAIDSGWPYLVLGEAPPNETNKIIYDLEMLRFKSTESPKDNIFGSFLIYQPARYGYGVIDMRTTSSVAKFINLTITDGDPLIIQPLFRQLYKDSSEKEPWINFVRDSIGVAEIDDDEQDIEGSEFYEAWQLEDVLCTAHNIMTTKELQRFEQELLSYIPKDTTKISSEVLLNAMEVY